MLDGFIDLFDHIGVEPYLALVIVLGVACQVLAWQLKVPSILLLLVVGFGLGQVISPDDVVGRDVLFAGVTIAVGVILFEGALSLSFAEVKELGKPVFRLCSVTVAVAWVLITGAGLLVGLDIGLALLMGAILVVTGPTVIAPILRTLRPSKRTATMLRWEGIVVDPVGAVLAVLVFQGIVAGQADGALLALLGGLGLTIAVAAVIALPLGYALDWLVRRHLIPDFLHGVTFLSAAIGSQVVSNHIQPESGLLTVTVLGIFLGNRHDLHLGHVREFTEHLQVLFVGALFVALAGRVSPGQIVDVFPAGLVLVVLLVAVIRPVSIALGLAGTTVTRAERRLLAGMAPRGIVAAAVTSIFALELDHAAHDAADRAAAASGTDAVDLAGEANRLSDLAAQATDTVVPLVFMVIVVTVAIYGLGVGRLAERLGLASGKPEGFLLAGGAPWVAEVAQHLEELDTQTLIVARDYNALATARKAGLTSVTANILSDYAVKDLDLAGIGRLVACTDVDEVNATAAREFAHVLGRANVYQLARGRDFQSHGAERRSGAASHLTARVAFNPPTTFEEMERRIAGGSLIKRTKLSEEFTFDDFKARYGESVVLLFQSRRGRVEVVTEDMPEPTRGETVIALVDVRD